MELDTLFQLLECICEYSVRAGKSSTVDSTMPTTPTLDVSAFGSRQPRYHYVEGRYPFNLCVGIGSSSVFV